MNFKWEEDIYKDDPESDTFKEKLKNEFLFPRFFRPIGLAIAFLPIIYRLSQVYFPLALFKYHYFSDRKLVAVLALGLLIELRAKNKVEDYNTLQWRETMSVGILLAAVWLVIPF